ncbi:MAG: hypothetical protein GX974_02060 [Clostridiales bacterium]|nr:hypothetical protein [Clostridiales bacterium]
MSNEIDYKENKIDDIDTQREGCGCPTLVHQRVSVQGTVTITPDIISGPSKTFCIGEPIIGGCPEDLAPSCSFTVAQNICVQIPLFFSATASTVSNGLACDPAMVGPCNGVPSQ